MNKSAELLKNIFLFFIANFLPKAITFFMVPLYTTCLTTSEYGTVDLLNTTVQLLLPFFTLQIQDAMLRFTMDKCNKKEDVFTVGTRIISAGSLIVVCGCLVLKLTGLMSLEWLYIFFLIFVFSTTAFKSIASYFCRGIDKVKCVTISNVLYTVIVVLCNLIFLLVFKWRVYGYLAALCLGSLISTVVLFFGARLWVYIKGTVSDKQLTYKIVLFSMPMIFSALSWWTNNSLDKYILRMFWDASAVGLLAVAYKIPSILSLLGNAVANAYSISAIKEFDADDADGFLGKSYHTINICYVVCCSFLILVNVPLSRLLFAKDFYSAWRLVPPLLVSALASQMSLTCEQYFIALKKTKIISATAIGGTLMNLALNIVLIPQYGAYGAATATAISFSMTWIMRYSIVRKYVKLKHDLFKECVSYLFVLMQVVLAFWEKQFIIWQLILFIGLLVLYGNDIFLLIKSLLKNRRDTNK